MKRIFTVLLAFLVLIFMPACGSSSKPAETASDPEEPSAETVAEESEKETVIIEEITYTEEPETDQEALDVEVALAGTWGETKTTTFTFGNGEVIRNSAGKESDGTYEIDTERHEIKVSINESIGHTNFRIHYTYEDGELTLSDGKWSRQE